MSKSVTPSVVSKVSEAIALKIIRGDYQPGDLLPGENDLCKQFQVSRTSIRGALQILVGKRIVVTEPKRGTRVNQSDMWDWLDRDFLTWSLHCKPDKMFIRPLLEARLIFEPSSAALAAINARAKDLALMEQSYEQMVIAAENGDRQTFVQHDLSFHQALLFASHNPFIIALGELLTSIMLTSFSATLEEEVNPKTVALEEHFMVFEAVRLRKPKLAREHLRAIVLGSIDKLLDEKEAAFTAHFK